MAIASLLLKRFQHCIEVEDPGGRPLLRGQILKILSIFLEIYQSLPSSSFEGQYRFFLEKKEKEIRKKFPSLFCIFFL